MKAKTWKSRIKKACEDAGTYRSFFDYPIETLAEILERRDAVQEKFNKPGGDAIVKHTNKNGSVYLEQNPMLRIINDLNRDALAYWRDLGLTPAGLKKINEKSMEKPKRSALAEAMRALG